MKPADYDKLWDELQTLYFIPLTKGKFAVIDGVDSKFSLTKWTYWNYALRKIGRATTYLHRLIVNSPDEVDHRNRDKLDNRRSNLRVASRSQNQANASKPNKTGYRGVYYVPRSNRYEAWVNHPKAVGKKEYVGVSASAVEAAEMRDKRAKEIWGEFAFLNFPD